MRWYADENVPLRVVEELRHLGHDLLSAYEDGRANQAIPDEKVLVRATELGRALLTLNRRDFKRLHAAYPKHSGIVSCTYSPKGEGSGLVFCLSTDFNAKRPDDSSGLAVW
jgi:Domain of unknown function (DUF5615)